MSARFRTIHCAAVLAALLFASGIASAQNRAQATDFTVQLFVSAKGELSPDIFTIEELGVHNFTFQGKGLEGGKFSGFLVRVEFKSPREIFAQGRQAQLIFRETKTNKVLKTWNISDVYIGDNGVAYRAAFFEDLDCRLMEATLVSGKTRIAKQLPFHCGE